MANQTSPNQALINSTAKDLLEEISRQSKVLDASVPEAEQAESIRALAEAYGLIAEHDNRTNSGNSGLNGYRNGS